MPPFSSYMAEGVCNFDGSHTFALLRMFAPLCCLVGIDFLSSTHHLRMRMCVSVHCCCSYPHCSLVLLQFIHRLKSELEASQKELSVTVSLHTSTTTSYSYLYGVMKHVASKGYNTPSHYSIYSELIVVVATLCSVHW